jgi:hypothetical protein
VRQLAARSASRPVWERLLRSDPGPESGRVAAAFERACYLDLADSGLVVLVLSKVGDGPLSVVTDGEPSVFAGAKPGTPVHLVDQRLRLGALEVTMEGARVWEPRPDWETLRARSAQIAERLPLVLALALECAPEDSLLALLPGSSARLSDSFVCDAFLVRAWQAGMCLRAGWGKGRGADGQTRAGSEEGLSLLRAGAAQLAGLGSGLTPAGDDFLTGAMLWAWLAHPAPNDYCDALLSASVMQTTILSAALLQAAARGECSAPWHDMLRALADGSDADLARSVQRVQAHGHTSGADTLAGFLWIENR